MAHCGYICTARVRGIPRSADCKPSPAMTIANMEAAVTAYFLDRFGPTPVMRRVFRSGQWARRARPLAWRPTAGDCARTALQACSTARTDAAWFPRAVRPHGAESWENGARRTGTPGRNAVDHDRAHRGPTSGAKPPIPLPGGDLLATYGVKAVLYPRGATYTTVDTLSGTRRPRLTPWTTAAKPMPSKPRRPPHWPTCSPKRPGPPHPTRTKLACWDQDDQATDDLSVIDDTPGEPYDLAA